MKKVSLKDAFRHAILNAPDGSRRDHRNNFREIVRSNPAYIEALEDEYFDREYAQWRHDRVGGVDMLRGTTAVERRAENIQKRAESASRIEKARTELAAEIRPFIWFEMQVADGKGGHKKLRECTGAELKRLGGVFLELSTHLKPTERLDSKLSEKDVRNIYARFDSKRRATGKELHA